MRALEHTFTAYGETLERVEVFQYLGRLVSYTDDDQQAMRSNLMKGRRTWARISRVLRAENAEPRVCGMFYKATVQAIVLYGSESWNLTTTALKCLEGFHLRAARRMAGKMPVRNASGTWTYPASEEVLKKAGLYGMAHHIWVRRQTIAKFIVNRPIFDLCRAGNRIRGSSVRQFWWEQPCDFVEARASSVGGAIVASEDDEEELSDS